MSRSTPRCRHVATVALTLTLTMTLAMGCGGKKGGLRVFAEAAVHGELVVITAGVDLEIGRKTTFAVNGVEQTVADNWGHFGFALAGLPPGTATFQVSARRDDGKAGKTRVSVVIPAQPGSEPSFHLASCGGPGAIRTVKLAGDKVSPRMAPCGLDATDGTITLVALGSRATRVSIGGAVLEFPDAAPSGLPLVTRSAWWIS